MQSFVSVEFFDTMISCNLIFGNLINNNFYKTVYINYIETIVDNKVASNVRFPHYNTLYRSR